jgi:2',3'-cyclic-nucleotide 2'-phosphodiesterase (5'-nucleotidase family)
LTYGALYEAFPFDNRIVRLEMRGADLRRVIEAQLRLSRDPLGTSGIRVRAACSGGRLAVTLLRASGQPINDAEPLIVVTTDFLATGGDRVFMPIMPARGFVIDDEAPLVRDVVADWLRQRGGRIREDQLIDLNEPRWRYPGSLPMRCG